MLKKKLLYLILINSTVCLILFLCIKSYFRISEKLTKITQRISDNRWLLKMCQEWFFFPLLMNICRIMIIWKWSRSSPRDKPFRTAANYFENWKLKFSHIFVWTCLYKHVWKFSSRSACLEWLFLQFCHFAFLSIIYKRKTSKSDIIRTIFYEFYYSGLDIKIKQILNTFWVLKLVCK